MRAIIIKLSVLLTLVLSFYSCSDNPKEKKNILVNQAQEVFAVPKRAAGQKDVIELTCEPIDTVRMAIIGLGMRGIGAVNRYTFLENVEIVALSLIHI